MGSMEFAQGRSIVARLPHGADLLEEIVALAARLAYYDQADKTYEEFALDRPLEITALAGNVSRRDGAPAAHVHLTLADDDGRAFGGHAAPGCVVFACELVVTELHGPSLERSHDDVTGLPLWRGL
jgi:predicted DNA-binding protein with PD1-like motif